MAQLISISGVTIKTPHTFVIERYNITQAGRVADGTMTMDLIAKKRKFLFEYRVISGIDMKRILDIIDGTNMFMPVAYKESNVIKTAECYVGHIPSTIFRTDGPWYYTDVNFDLIEQ